MAEWLKAAVLKTVSGVTRSGVRIPLPPPNISDRMDVTPHHLLLGSPEEWSDAAQDDISLDAVRRALATIHGSLSEAVLEERRER